MKPLGKLPNRVGRFAFVVLALVDFSSQAAPIQLGRHFYDFIPADLISWQDASIAAATNNFMGLTGHLATVMSGAENDFLRDNFATFPSFAGAWLGGQVNSANMGSWVVGPAAGLAFSQDGSALPGTYANWGGIEPNNAPSRPYMNVGPLLAGIQAGQWADARNGAASGGDPVQGYFVQYDSPVPEPMLNLTVTNSTSQLDWLGLTNVTYIVQTSTNLSTWTALGFVTATQANIAFTVSSADRQRFYRLFVP